jgi:UBX domain-containing protein 1/4
MATSAAVDSLMDMGFGPKEKCTKALNATKGNIEAAIEWMMSHPDDDGTSDSTDAGGAGSKDSSVGSQPTSVLDAASGSSSDQPPVVRSYKCVDTGRLFATMADVELYSERTGKTNFEETTEQKKPKSKEEIAAAQAHLMKVLKEKRRKREVEEKKRKIEAEKARRVSGQQMAQTRDELEKIARKREWEKARKEKQAAKHERERLRREIAKDKAERLARNGKLGSKLGVDGYKPAGQDLKAQSKVDAAAKKRKQTELLQQAGIRKAAPKESLPPPQLADKAVSALSKLKAGNVGQIALTTGLKMLQKILEKPDQGKFRRINLANEKFLKRLGGQPGGVPLLKSAGFERNEAENALIMSDDQAKDSARISMVIEKIQSTIV